MKYARTSSVASIRRPDAIALAKLILPAESARKFKSASSLAADSDNAEDAGSN
jgi:hypothetical protein